MNLGAWTRTEDNTYGFNKSPFGQCSECSKAACHRIPSEESKTGYRLVCRDHLPNYIVFSPFLGQQEKLFSATERYVLGGGGAGPGKTYAGARLWLKLFDVEQSRYEEAKSRGEHFQSKAWTLFCRRTMPELLQVIDDFLTYFKQIDPDAHWDSQNKLARFPNGMHVQFAGMEHDGDWKKYYGGEYTIVVLDEGVQFTKKQIDQIDTRIRSSDSTLSKMCQLYILTNPINGAAGTKEWLRRRFVRAADPETTVVNKVKLADGRIIIAAQVYIPCNLYDNPAYAEDGSYEATLAGKSVFTRRALLLNDWDVDEGAWVGEDWDPAFHVCDPFSIPSHWPRFKCGDYGFSSLSSVLWIAVSPEGWHVVYRAFNCKGLTAHALAIKVKEIEREPLRWISPTGKWVNVTGPEWDEENDISRVQGPMDASCWAGQGESADCESRGDQLERIGTGFYPSVKGQTFREQAGDIIRMRLRQRFPDAKGKLTIAGLRIFRGTTETKMVDEHGKPDIVSPYKSIPDVSFDEKNPEVWQSKQGTNDHDLDALGYGEVGHPPEGVQDQIPEVLDFIQARQPLKIVSERINW